MKDPNCTLPEDVRRYENCEDRGSCLGCGWLKGERAQRGKKLRAMERLPDGSWPTLKVQGIDEAEFRCGPPRETVWYEFYDKEGHLVAEGTDSMCTKALGYASRSSFRGTLVNIKSGRTKKYTVNIIKMGSEAIREKRRALEARKD